MFIYEKHFYNKSLLVKFTLFRGLGKSFSRGCHRVPSPKKIASWDIPGKEILKRDGDRVPHGQTHRQTLFFFAVKM